MYLALFFVIVNAIIIGVYAGAGLSERPMDKTDVATIILNFVSLFYNAVALIGFILGASQ